MESQKSLQLRKRLDRLTVKCPDCRQMWLVPGLTSGDEYCCKECGAVFLKSKAGVTQQSGV